MKRFISYMGIAALILVFSVPTMGFAGGSARLIPIGKVSLLQNGRATQQIGAEMPLPEGVLMLCNGQCLIRAKGMQLAAGDKAVFGVAEGAENWDVTVKSGRVDFTLRPDAKLVSFYTPQDTLRLEEVIVSAATNKMLRGSVIVTKGKTVFSVQEGTVRVSTEKGTQIVEAGKSIRLAQVQLSPAADKNKKKKAAGAYMAGSGSGAAAGGTILGLSTPAAVMTGAGVVAIGVGAGVAANSGGGGNKEESPSTPGNLQ